MKKVVHLLRKVVYLFEYQTIKFTNSFQANYNKILEVLKSITEKEQFLKQKRKPKLKGKGLIAMNLITEYVSIDIEYQLFGRF